MPGRGRSTSWSRRQPRGVRRRPASGRLRAGRMGRGLQPDLSVRGSPAAPRVRRGRDVAGDRHRVARLRLAAARRHRRGDHGGAAVPARPDPVQAPLGRRPRRTVRARRRDVLRPVADRHERRLRRPVHHRRLYRLRRAMDGLVARPGGVLGGDAGDRGAARAGPGQQMGGRLRDRGVGAADPRPERARTGAGDPRHDRVDDRARVHGHQRAGRRGLDRSRVRQPDVPADHGRADARCPWSWP